MKSYLARNIATAGVVIAAAAVLALAGCGQPGPLYMPKPPAKAAPATTTPATPVPSTAVN